MRPHMHKSGTEMFLKKECQYPFDYSSRFSAVAAALNLKGESLYFYVRAMSTTKNTTSFNPRERR